MIPLLCNKFNALTVSSNEFIISRSFQKFLVLILSYISSSKFITHVS